MGLFSDIYNTVAKFFRPQEIVEGDQSKSVATNRLKLVLMQDRTNLTPKILEQMRGEMIDLLSKYLEMDKELLELNFEQDGDQVALMLSIPVIRAKDEDEIEAAIQEAKNKTEEVVDTDDEDDLAEDNVAIEDEQETDSQELNSNDADGSQTDVEQDVEVEVEVENNNDNAETINETDENNEEKEEVTVSKKQRTKKTTSDKSEFEESVNTEA